MCTFKSINKTFTKARNRVHEKNKTCGVVIWDTNIRFVQGENDGEFLDVYYLNQFYHMQNNLNH